MTTTEQSLTMGPRPFRLGVCSGGGTRTVEVQAGSLREAIRLAEQEHPGLKCWAGYSLDAPHQPTESERAQWMAAHTDAALGGRR